MAQQPPQPQPDAYNDPLGLQEQGHPADPASQEFFEAQAREQFDSLMATVVTYSTPEGKKELQRLRAATIEAATWMASIAVQQGMDAATAHGFAREGQNALVRDIENRIDLAKKVKTPEDLHDLLHGV